MKRHFAFIVGVMLALFLAACAGTRGTAFPEATGINLDDAHITLAEYVESGADFSEVFLSEKALSDILSAIQMERGKKQDAMPNQCFFFHLSLPNGETTELVVGCNGEIIAGEPDKRSFWVETGKSAYQGLLECTLSARS